MEVMRVVGRLIKWSCFCCVLTAAATLTFLFVRYQPRTTIRGPLVVDKLSSDGARLITSSISNSKRLKGPLQIWDTRDSSLLCQFFGDAPLLALQWSRDGRHAAVVLGDETLHLIDLAAGEKWQVSESRPRIDEREPANDLQFSTKGHWLCVRQRDWHETLFVSVARPIVTRKINGSFIGYAGDDRFVFSY